MVTERTVQPAGAIPARMKPVVEPKPAKPDPQPSEEHREQKKAWCAGGSRLSTCPHGPAWWTLMLVLAQERVQRWGSSLWHPPAGRVCNGGGRPDPLAVAQAWTPSRAR